MNRMDDLCSLNRQFLAYKGTVPGPSGGTVQQTGQADVIDPLQIPNRL